MELTEIKTEAERLQEALNLSGELIAVSYRDEADGDLETKTSPCGALLAVRDGETVTLSADNCSCPGGVSHLGLADRELNKGMRKLLVEGEKLWRSVAASYRGSFEREGKKAPPPTNLGDYINLVPLSEVGYQPDLIIAVCNATQASRITMLSGYQDGIIPSVEVGGSMCWGSITYPIVSGKFNVTMGDYTARRIWDWDPGELIVSMPLQEFKMVLESVDGCTAGFAEPSEEFEKLTEQIRSD